MKNIVSFKHVQQIKKFNRLTQGWEKTWSLPTLPKIKACREPEISQSDSPPFSLRELVIVYMWFCTRAYAHQIPACTLVCWIKNVVVPMTLNLVNLIHPDSIPQQNSLVNKAKTKFKQDKCPT